MIKKDSILDAGKFQAADSDEALQVETVSASNSTSDSEVLNQAGYLDPLVRINTLKFMTSTDLRVASNVKFALVDLRYMKKPRLCDIYK